jgi:hypothetical protein
VRPGWREELLRLAAAFDSLLAEDWQSLSLRELLDRKTQAAILDGKLRRLEVELLLELLALRRLRGRRADVA